MIQSAQQRNLGNLYKNIAQKLYILYIIPASKQDGMKIAYYKSTETLLK